MVDLWIVRHAQSLGNIERSGANTPLSPLGETQARTLGERLSNHQFDAVWASPLTRAQQTATLALPEAELGLEPRLSEFLTGPDGKYVDTSNLDAEQLLALLRDAAAVPSETGREFMVRVRDWISELPPTGAVLAFTHFAVVREIVGTLLGMDQVPRDIDFASIFMLNIGEGGVKRVMWNDVRHLSRVGLG